MRTFKLGLAAAGLLGLSALAAVAASAYSGTWKVTDTDGKPFNIVLADDGAATADRADKPMKGTWKEDASGVVITWDTGWVTKIAKDGTGFKKSAYDKGKPLDGPASNSSPAEKVK